MGLFFSCGTSEAGTEKRLKQDICTAVHHKISELALETSRGRNLGIRASGFLATRRKNQPLNTALSKSLQNASKSEPQ